MGGFLLLAITIAFPVRPVPYVTDCYMIGAVPKGETNVVVQGRNVEVYRTGAWATMVSVTEGVNTVRVERVNGEFTNHVFRVAAKPKPRPVVEGAPPPPKKKYEKLPYAADTAKEPPTNRAPSEVTVVVDPGHGGSDTGAVSPHGHFEKEANLLLAEEVRDALAARGYRVVMTREDDSFPALYDRPRVAHREGADAFISIHHNAPAADRDAAKLRYSTTYAWNDIGEGLARRVNAALAASNAGEPTDNGVQRANYAVTRNPEIPSCLVEVDFVTSPAGEEAAWDGLRRRRIAAAIAEGFDAWRKGE